MDDVGGVGTKFKRAAAEAGFLLQGFADWHAAREREHADAVILGQVFADEGAGAGQEVEAASRQSGIAEDIAEKRCRQRRGRSWLIDHRVAGRKCRTNLVSREVYREIERRDGADDTERLANREGEFMLAVWRAGKRNRLALKAFGFFGRENQRLISTANLAVGIMKRLACFGRKGAGKVLDTVAHEICCFEDDFIALVW